MHPDWLELLGSLSSHSVEYLVIGGAATAIHAQPRYTDDLDLWVRPSAENVGRLRTALTELGFRPKRSDLHAFQSHDRRKIVLGEPPSAVDLFNFQTGVAFDDAWRDRVPITLAGTSVMYIGSRDLVRIKRAAGGDLDEFDLCLIEEIQGKLE